MLRNAGEGFIGWNWGPFLWFRLLIVVPGLWLVMLFILFMLFMGCPGFAEPVRFCEDRLADKLVRLLKGSNVVLVVFLMFGWLVTRGMAVMSSKGVEMGDWGPNRSERLPDEEEGTVLVCEVAGGTPDWPKSARKSKVCPVAGGGVGSRRLTSGWVVVVVMLGPGSGVGAVRSGSKEDSTAAGEAESDSPSRSKAGGGQAGAGVGAGAGFAGGGTDSSSGLLTKKLLCPV